MLQLTMLPWITDPSVLVLSGTGFCYLSELWYVKHPTCWFSVLMDALFYLSLLSVCMSSYRCFIHMTVSFLTDGDY